MNWKEEELLPYRLGGLLYTPALNEGIAEKLRRKAIPDLRALALCLEDSIQDEALPRAEAALLRTLTALDGVPERPLLFVRIRSPRHLRHVHRLLGPAEGLLTGYILPKFDLSNGEEYARLFKALNAGRETTPLYMMPTLESGMVAEPGNRTNLLLRVKRILDSVGSYVLNVRVGGNDLCNLYGLRRSVSQTIYDVGVIRDILMDILQVFAADYVVSGPVWEYFGQDPGGPWARGLRAELALDCLNGFVGKTAVHPNQLPVICQGLRVSREDYEDARRILGWRHEGLGVERSAAGGRMNEVKCHSKWAGRVCKLAAVYGVQEEGL